MNYRHIYHAGNFADIAKHVGLLYCLNALQRKEAGFSLSTAMPDAASMTCRRRSAEIRRGGTRRATPDRQCPGRSNPRRLLQGNSRAARQAAARYPGSPALIAQALRPQDRALFVELLPAEARAAEREIESLGRVRTEIQDGYAALKAYLPPDERRGLVLIDRPMKASMSSK